MPVKRHTRNRAGGLKFNVNKNITKAMTQNKIRRVLLVWIFVPLIQLLLQETVEPI